MKNYHFFHLVEMSPWPLMVSLSLGCCTINTVYWFHSKHFISLIFSLVLLAFLASLWWRDVIRESTFQGYHTKVVVKGLKLGMILFIISEVMFFFSFFWMFFHSALSPTWEIGSLWPPKSILPFDPMGLPLLNTAILLSSGFSLTWSHYALLARTSIPGLSALSITIFLGILFTGCQIFEYYHAPFSLYSSVYGSAFFMMTGFHGLHVLIGTIFLTVTYYRFRQAHFSSTHHVGFEMSAWYWHFVDVVWLFLYLCLYWWGS